MDIDAVLRQLKDLPVDPRVAGIEAAVLDGIAAEDMHGRPLSGSLVGIAASVALAVGLLGATLPGYAEPAPSIAPFGTPAALAPSTLLGTGE